MKANDIKAKLLEILIDEGGGIKYSDLIDFFCDEAATDDDLPVPAPVVAECLDSLIADETITFRYNEQKQVHECVADQHSREAYYYYSGYYSGKNYHEPLAVAEAETKNKTLHQFVKIVREAISSHCDYEMGYVPTDDVRLICEVVLYVAERVQLQSLFSEVIKFNDVADALKGDRK